MSSPGGCQLEPRSDGAVVPQPQHQRSQQQQRQRQWPQPRLDEEAKEEAEAWHSVLRSANPTYVPIVNLHRPSLASQRSRMGGEG